MIFTQCGWKLEVHRLAFELQELFVELVATVVALCVACYTRGRITENTSNMNKK